MKPLLIMLVSSLCLLGLGTVTSTFEDLAHTNAMAANGTRGYALVVGNRCNVTMFNIDATGYVQDFAQPQLDRIAATIDSRIGEIDVSRVLNPKDLYHIRFQAPPAP